MPFKALGISEPILRSLHEEGYRTPTPIQQQAIPIVLQGKDLLGVAQTGTGKTAAFAVPIIQLLSAQKPHGKKRSIRSLILTPTRELAVQIEESFHAYGRHSGLTSVVIFGGVKQGAQTRAVHSGVDIVIATPGRLLDLMDQGHIDLRHVEIFVLDEADRMLDMGFVRDVKDIIAELPNERQTLFFSATMPAAIVSLASDILYQPVKIAVTPPASTVDLIQQSVYFVEKSKKPDLLIHLLQDKNIRSALVFTRTKRGADVVARTLERNHIYAEAIHGNKAQNARQRAMTNFKEKKTRVLVATDIAARGIDVDDLEYVINYEIPNVPETYVHRIGRTGRAGAAGTAISFCAPDEKPYLKDIEKLTNKRIPAAHDQSIAKAEHTPRMEHTPRTQHAPKTEHAPRTEHPPKSASHSRGQQTNEPDILLRLAKLKSQQGEHPQSRPQQGKPQQGRPPQGKPQHGRRPEGKSGQQSSAPQSGGQKRRDGGGRRKGPR